MKLPEIKITKVTDVMYSDMQMDVPDEVYNKFVEFGKQDATDQDYFNIAFRNAMEESIKNMEAKEKQAATDAANECILDGDDGE
jgi:hypothetical protein